MSGFGEITRRGFVSSMCTLPLIACTSGETATVRYRLIATAYVDREKVEGFSVMEVRYSRDKNSLIGSGGAAVLYGEALILGLKDRGAVYMLPTRRATDGTITEIYQHGILSTFGIKDGVGTLSDADFQRLQNAKGRTLFQYYSSLPLFEAFGDESNPKSIREVAPGNMAMAFPGVRFGGLDVEITTAPTTKILKSRLAWLNTPARTEVFGRYRPGHMLAAKKTVQSDS